MALTAWLLLVPLAWCVTLRGVYAGGRTPNDHLMAGVITGCFGLYGLLGIGALLALEGLPGVLALLGLGLGALLLAPPFVILSRRREPGRIGWWLMLGSQPAYAFAFWGGCTFAPWLAWAGAAGDPLLWPGHWLWPAVVLSIWGSVFALAGGELVRRHLVELPGLRGSRLRVVHLSDIHFGPGFPARLLRAQCERVAGLEPDLVVVTGDLVGPFSDAPGEHDALIEALAALPVPVLFCPGNHDMPRWDTMGPALRAAGITVLDGEDVLLEVGDERVWAFGAAFHWGGARRENAAAIDGARPPDDASLRLVLVHDPRLLDLLRPEAADVGFAGHTHGGPVSLRMFGLPLSILRLTASHDHGLHRRAGVWHHVHAGNWLIGMPPRIGTVPEIAVLEILRPRSG